MKLLCLAILDLALLAVFGQSGLPIPPINPRKKLAYITVVVKTNVTVVTSEVKYMQVEHEGQSHLYNPFATNILSVTSTNLP